MNSELQRIIAKGLLARMEEINTEACRVYMNYVNGNISEKLYNYEIDKNTKKLAELLADAKAVGYCFNTKSFNVEVCESEDELENKINKL